MERLTDKKEADAQRREYEIRLKQGYPRNIPEERFLRLAAYEDTGLEPGEIEQLKGEVLGLRLDKQELEQYRALGPIDRLRELKQADDEGRCVVLPFKPPRWVYMCSARFPKPAKAHYASAINVLHDMDNGCVFGDTPKEAEAALRREQDG